MLNTQLFTDIQASGKQILLVTKYWDTDRTKKILSQAESEFWKIVYGIWENRIEQIKEKNLPRKNIHFIGNIQSQKIPEIVQCCSFIHSLSSLKHAEKIENQGLETKAFIQIRLDTEKNIWISEEELWDFLTACKNFRYLKIIWISGMWAGDIWETEKRREFQKLIQLRDTHLPKWLISAGTSWDYKIALEEWVDIVRVGRKIMEI